MFGTEIIEVGIGMAFGYFVISVICSGIVELGVKITKLRSKHLKEALGVLLDDKNYNGFVKELYEHHLISLPLKEKLKEQEPTYIDAKHFASAVLDILGKNDKLSDADQFKLIEARINTIKDDKVRNRLLKILNSSAQEFDTFRDKIENWFNDSMAGVSEWYKQRMRAMVTIISVVVVTAMNADSLRMATMFWNDDELRAATVETAQTYAESVQSKLENQPLDSASNTIKASLDAINKDIAVAKTLPIGWGSEVLPGKPGFNVQEDPIKWWLLKIAGLFLTVGAVSLGSTYWYRQLKSLLNFRFGEKDKGAGDAPAANVNVTVVPASNETATTSSAAVANTPAAPETPPAPPVDDSGAVG